MDQQSEASTLGMWLFLATEVMFFGGLLTAYAVYRTTLSRRDRAGEQRTLRLARLCQHDRPLDEQPHHGAGGPCVGIAGAVRMVGWLGLTMVLGTVFLGIKAVEYTHDYREQLVPGLNFQVPEHDRELVAQEGLDPGRMQMFFVLYFFMTGLHAIHLIIGIVLVGVMAWLSWRGWFSGGGAVQIEVTGLYWHFIDIVWVFLYPLLYLIDVHK